MSRFPAALAAALLAASPAAAAFKDPSWSARAAALGGAFVAVSDDPTGVFYNPAAFSGLESRQASFGRAQLFAGLDGVDLSLNAFAYAHPLSGGRALGAGWGRFSAAGLADEDTAVLSYTHRFPALYPGDETGFSAAVSARRLSVSFDVDGLTAADPVFRRGRSRDAAAFDLHFHTGARDGWLPGVSFGLSARALNSPDIGFTTEDRVPREFVLGARWTRGRLSVPVDVSVRDGEVDPRGGAELSFFDGRMALRAGAEADQVGTGFGYKYPLSTRNVLLLDYAFMYPLRLDSSSGSHRVTVGLTF